LFFFFPAHALPSSCWYWFWSSSLFYEAFT
jgi:hypothetical protein